MSFPGSGGNTSPVTRYTAVCVSQNGGGTRTGVGIGAGVRSINITGLSSGKSYKCSVNATNNIGAGPSTTSTRFFAP